MALEDLTGSDKFIDDLVNTNPVGATDLKSTLDDHIRGIKNVLLNQFPNLTEAVTASAAELNIMDGVSATTAEINHLSGLTATPLQSDTGDIKTASLTFNDDVQLRFGNSGGEARLYSDGSDFFIETQGTGGRDFFIKNGSVNQYWFDMSSGDLHANGDIYAFSTSVSSDPKLKRDIAQLTDALKLLRSIKGYTWNWKKDGKPSAGVLSTEVKQVLPDAVTEVQGPNGGESHEVVNYNAIIALLVEGVTAMDAKMKRISRRLTQLELAEAARREEE